MLSLHLDTASYLTWSKQVSELLQKCLKISNTMMYCKQESLNAFQHPLTWNTFYCMGSLHCYLLLNFIIRYCSLSRGILRIGIMPLPQIFCVILYTLLCFYGNVQSKTGIINTARIRLACKGEFCPNLTSSLLFSTNSFCFSCAGWSYNYHTNERISYSN